MSYFANRGGIPRIQADSVSVTATAATYNVSSQAFIPIRYSGLVLFKLPEYTAPTTAVPVVFNTSGVGTQPLTYLGGTAVTSTELSGAGIILCYYENGTLQLLSILTA